MVQRNIVTASNDDNRDADLLGLVAAYVAACAETARRPLRPIIAASTARLLQHRTVFYHVSD